MKFSFQSSLDEKTCLRIINTVSSKTLETDKIFDGEIKENKFRLNYTTTYRDTSSTIHQAKKLPNCTVTGQLNSIGSGTLLEGSVTLVKVRLILIAVIFTVVFIAVALFFHFQNLPMKVLFYFIPAYTLFFIAEYLRFHTTKNEALDQFRKLFIK